MMLPSLQMVSNQSTGMVIAAVLSRVKYKRASKLPQGNNNYIPPEYWLGNVIPMSAILQEAYQYRAEVTEHAVESGVIFSDHVILRPVRLEVEFEVSNYDGLGSDAQSAKDSLDLAIGVWENRQPFTIMTTHRLLENMVCLELHPVNEAPQWGKLHFRATFQQIKLVQLQTVQFPAAQVQGLSEVNSQAQPGGPNTGLSAASPAPMAAHTPRTTATPVVPKTTYSKGGASGTWSNWHGASVSW
jgi:hypothetical protein